MHNILISGGINSSFMLVRALREYRNHEPRWSGGRLVKRKKEKVVATFVDYGQKAVNEERKAAKSITEQYEVDLFCISSTSLSMLYVRDFGLEVNMPDKPAHGQEWERFGHFGGLTMTLVSAAASVPGTTVIHIGYSRENMEMADENTDLYIDALNKFTNPVYGYRVSLPLRNHNRGHIAATATHSSRTKHPMFALDLTWSCDEPYQEGVPCGRCRSCTTRSSVISKLEDHPQVVA